ncbi:MAG: CehA/McbA family metallohydrolase [Gemmatimonadota bacterium]|nr:CehA/McbA family metallohydrolase [Gemmatimonadota bacterium]
MAKPLGVLVGLALAVVPILVSAQQREAVLKQVRVPHGYYWREMYVPQLTTGPSAVTWSPDGREVIYSMQGSLWRQRLGSTEAWQLTAGPGYDYQPDWSPDGRSVVYASYRNDAIELRLLDLASGADTVLLADGAVNVEPRWSPDGGRLAFVSTAHEGRWHVYTGNVVSAVRPALTGITRIAEDRDSKLPRYYYSVFDHYLSPTWSPDGRELIVVSNRGRIWGTGGFWRMTAAAGSAPQEIHYEETTWKARPDWARDGKRVVYSSYHGRQWNQLWLMTGDGGDPLQLTYGDFDATAPRWSPDGRRIAYISNEGGNTALWTIALPGGRRERIEARTRRYLRPTGWLDLTTVDRATGRAVPARVSVWGAGVRSYAPDDAWHHSDEAFVRGEQRVERGYFHTRGRSRLAVPADSMTVEVSRGPEYRIARRTVSVGAGETRALRIELERIVDMRGRGWWSGDMHVHMNYGGAYRNTPAQLALQARAEDLYLIENLVVNKEQRIPDIAYFTPRPDPVSTPDFLLMHGQEFHTSVWGHTALLGLREHYLLPDYAGYVNTAVASLAPTNATIADLARAQGAIVGYVHPFDTRPDPTNAAEALTNELPADVALGKVDYLEVMGYSDHLVTSEVWYRLLNCGFRIPAGAGTDAFPNFAALRGPPGLVRTYVRTGARPDHARWLAGIVAGRTFVTNAPLLNFTLAASDGGAREPGDEIRLPRGRNVLNARLTMRSAIPIDHLELIANGRVIASITPHRDRTVTDTTMTIPIERSGWYVLRARSARPTAPVLDLYPFGSTSPIYVTVGEEPTRSTEDAEYFIAWIRRLESVALSDSGWNTAGEKAEVLAMLAQAREEYERRR